MLVLFELCCCCTTGPRRVLRPASTRRRRSWVHVPGAASSWGFRWQLWGWKSDICNLEVAAVTETFKKSKGRAYSTADTDEVGRGWGERCSTQLPTGAMGSRGSPGQREHCGARCMEAPKGHRGPQHPRDVAQNSHPAGCGRGAQREPLRAERRTGIPSLLSLEAIQIFSPAD